MSRRDLFGDAIRARLGHPASVTKQMPRGVSTPAPDAPPEPTAADAAAPAAVVDPSPLRTAWEKYTRAGSVDGYLGIAGPGGEAPQETVTDAPSVQADNAVAAGGFGGGAPLERPEPGPTWTEDARARVFGG